MKRFLCIAFPVFVFGALGALIEDHLWPQHGPYVFIAFTILGTIIGAVLTLRFAPVHIITKEDELKGR